MHFGKGVDNIDVDAATERGIWVANVRDANWDEVSNHVLALLLAWARGLPSFDRGVRALAAGPNEDKAVHEGVVDGALQVMPFP